MISNKQQYIIDSKFLRVDNNPIRTAISGVLAGMFISIGALLMAIGKAEGCNSIVCGMIFSCGLFFVVTTASELFTGNCLICGLSNKVEEIVRLLTITYISNLVGAIIIGIAVIMSSIDYTTLSVMAVAKCSMSPIALLVRGFLCNFLVCLAIWIGVYNSSNDSKIDKFISVLIPVTAFVACGFEHSVANMFILPFGFLSGDITLFQLLGQLIFVTIGNILGGFFIGYSFNVLSRKG